MVRPVYARGATFLGALALLLLSATGADNVGEFANTLNLLCMQNAAAYSCNDVYATGPQGQEGVTLCQSDTGTDAGKALREEYKGNKLTNEAWNLGHDTGCGACAAWSAYMQNQCEDNETRCYDGCDNDGTTDPNEDSFMVSYGYIIGIMLTVGGCFISNLGTNLQKVSMNANSLKPQALQLSVVKQPKWVIGTTCMVLGSIADFVALAFAPQSLLAPLATFTLVFNVFMAQYLNKETPSTMNIGATCVIVLATVIIVTNGDSDAKCYKLHELICRFQDNWTLVYLFCTGAFMAVAAYKARVLDREADAKNIPMQERKNVALWMAPFGGVCGGNTFLCAKTVAELIKAQFREEDGVISFPALLIAAGLVGNLLMQVRYLNEALRRFDILLIVPVYQTFWILSGTMAGLIYFKEYVVISRKPARATFFFIGVVLAIFGVGLLAKGARAEETKRASLRTSVAKSQFNSDDESTGLMQADGMRSSRGGGDSDRPSIQQRDSVVMAFTQYMARSSQHYEAKRWNQYSTGPGRHTVGQGQLQQREPVADGARWLAPKGGEDAPLSPSVNPNTSPGGGPFRHTTVV